MDKNIIKNHLVKRFVSEEATPGISVTDRVKKESGKINKAGVKAVDKDIATYEKPLTKPDKDASKMATNKYNYTDEAEKKYHEELEILNGQEMIEYTSEPGAEFKKRAEEAIVGSSRMGNAIGGNAEAAWGASSDDFGKNLVKRVKDSSKKRADAEIQTYGMGDVQIPTGNKVQVATTAMGAGKPKGDNTKAMQSASEKSKIKTIKEGLSEKGLVLVQKWVAELGARQAGVKMIDSVIRRELGGMTSSDLADSMVFANGLDKIEISLTSGKFENAFATAKTTAAKMIKAEGMNETKNNNNTIQIKESMKRLKFKAPFLGTNTTQKLGHALTLIPENFRVDKKEFEMTDGNINCRVRWEGTLAEGKAVVVTAKNNALVTEDISRMKALFGYKSEDTLGTVKGAKRLDENAAFADIWKKSRKLLGESEEIEDADAEKEAPFEEAGTKVAPEAKKHIEGSVSTDKGTQAPAPKKGEWEKISVPQAKDAKKHIEGTTSDDKGTQAPKPKEGHWEEIKKKAPEATKAVESGKPTNKATDKAKVVTENEEEEETVATTAPVAPKPATPTPPVASNDEEGGEEEEDTFYKSDDDDDSAETEPTGKDIATDVPSLDGGEEDGIAVPPVKGAPKLLSSPSNPGKLWIQSPTGPVEVPAHLMDLARKNTKLALQKMQDEVDFAPEENPEEEF